MGASKFKLVIFIWILSLLAFSSQVFPNSGGISGRSKQANTCNSCHGGANFNASISLQGESSVTTGSTNNIIIQLTHTGAAGGFNLSASAGTLQAGTGSRVLAGELTHNQPRSNTNGLTTWSIDWVAPNTTGTETLYVCGNAVNLNGNNLGDENNTPCTTMDILVNSANLPPIANDDNVTTDEDTEVTIDVLSNDIDSDGSLQPSTVTIIEPAVNGETSIDEATGMVTYRPSDSFFGNDSFSYTVEDDDGATSNVALVSVTVNEVAKEFARFDYDGDGKADVGVRRASTRFWYILNSSGGNFNSDNKDGIQRIQFGLWQDDIPVPADFDGDGISDIAVRRPAQLMWYILNSSGSNFNSNSGDGIQRIRFGLQEADIPVPADYDGDGIADVAVRRPNNFMWYILNSSGSNFNSDRGDGIQRIRFGLQEEDIPVPADYDGDGIADVAVRRASNQMFYILNSSDGKVQRIKFGLQEADIPINAPITQVIEKLAEAMTFQ